jgi:beta-N-acetylhexosaminidase
MEIFQSYPTQTQTNLQEKHKMTLTLKEKIGQLFMIGFYGTEAEEEVQTFIRNNNIGFVILFSRNIQSPSQIRELTDSIHALSNPHSVYGPLIYTDQEGGTIVRFGELAATAISAMGIAATGSHKNAELAGAIIAEDMKALGIDGVFAPVLDVNIEADNPVIGVRAFSDDPDTVITYGTHFNKGLKSKGLLTCGKHFPGHGAAAADSHLEIPEIPLTLAEFNRYCFPPFAALVRQGIDSIMTAHIRFPHIHPDIATLSDFYVPQLLRKQAGFNGVVFSDCLEMHSIKKNFSADQIVTKTMAAGLDVLVPSHELEYQQELLDRLLFNVQNGIIPESRIDESLQRINILKNRYLESQAGQTGHAKSSRIQLRQNLDREQELADGSITVLRNTNEILPINKESQTLIIEWQKKIVGPNVLGEKTASTTDVVIHSMVEPVAAEFLTAVDYIPLQADESKQLSEALEQRLISGTDTYVIVFIYSRPGKVGNNQSEAVKQILQLRSDAIIVSLETPYEIKKYPAAETFLVSYGFRKVQVNALFRILTGQIPAKGILPIKND